MINLSGVYLIENTVNRNRYIGSSVNLMHRKYVHFRELGLGIHRNSHLQRAFEKYGGMAFTFAVLLLCEPFELLRYEQALIDHLQPEYNLYVTAGSPLGMKQSEETKKKMREAHLGRMYKPMSDEGKRNLSDAHKGKKPSEENNRKRLEAVRGHPKSEETKQKIRLANTGHHHSDETRKKLHDHHLGKKPTNLEQLAAYRRGRPLTEEHKKHISEALKRRNAP
jgi:group I intron endonuclease